MAIYLPQAALPAQVRNPPAIVQYAGRDFDISMFHYDVFNPLFDYCIHDGIERFNKIYSEQTNMLAIEKYSKFTNELRKVSITPHFSFYPDGVKTRFTIGDVEFAAEYDLDDPLQVIVSRFVGSKLYIRDGLLSTFHTFVEDLYGLS
jgi:hypothetical protein